MGNLYEELKRRRVFRVAVVYAVVAWVLIQIADTVLPALQMPQWTISFVTVLFILGFIPTLIAAWAYDITPEGVKADRGIQLTQSSTTSGTDRKLIYAILGLVLLVVGFQIVDQFNTDSESANPIAITNSQATEAVSSSERVTRAIIPLGPMASLDFNLDLRTFLSLSPDGTRLAYTSFSEGKMQLHLRELDQLQSRPLGPPIENPLYSSLVFSPDGEWLAFFDQGSLKKIALNGGGVQAITDPETSINFGLDWSADDVLLFGGPNLGVAQSEASSGVVQELVSPMSANDAYFWPRFLRGSDVILYTRVPGPGATETILSVLLFDKQTDESRLLIQNAANAIYSATGHIVFTREGSLWAVPFDRENLQINGIEVRLIEGVDGLQRFGMSTYTLSKNGNLLYLPGEGAELGGIRNNTVSWIDRNGKETPLELPPQAYSRLTLSPDGTQLALTISQPEFGGSDLWNYDLSRRTLSKITFSGQAFSPIWYPAGDRLAYDTLQGIRAINSTGIGSPEVLLSVPNSPLDSRQLTAFTPDGTGLLYSEYIPDGGNTTLTSINQLSLAPEHTIQEVIARESLTDGGVISPNGRWLAYATSETGQEEVYIQPWPDVDSDKWPISSRGGSDPQWAADTGELFYRNNTEEGIETWAVSVATEGDFNAGIPDLLFTSDHILRSIGSSYSVSSDGQRFLMLKPVADEDEDAEPVAVDTNLVLVDNFAAELRRLVPANPN